jgi:diadenosine tetraphosphate (Ap4A) HIT family hydrolase
VAQAGRVLQRVFGADKMNYQMLGNAVPHLHAHLIPRYFTDPAPQRPIDPTPHGQEVYLPAAEYHQRIAKIREALK